MRASPKTATPSKVDATGQSVRVRTDGVVLVDGIQVFKAVPNATGVNIQFFDADRSRSACRGTRFVEVPLEVLKEIIEDACE